MNPGEHSLIWRIADEIERHGFEMEKLAKELHAAVRASVKVSKASYRKIKCRKRGHGGQ